MFPNGKAIVLVVLVALGAILVAGYPVLAATWGPLGVQDAKPLISPAPWEPPEGSLRPEPHAVYWGQVQIPAPTRIYVFVDWSRRIVYVCQPGAERLEILRTLDPWKR